MTKKRQMGAPHQRRSRVSVEMDALTAALYAPKRLQETKDNNPAKLEQSGPVLESHYVVTTRRRDLDWEYTVETTNGEQWHIPPAVLERFLAHRESIIKEQRSERGTANATKRQSGQDAQAHEWACNVNTSTACTWDCDCWCHAADEEADYPFKRVTVGE